MSHNQGEQIPEPVLKDIEKLDETSNILNDQIQDLKTKSTQVANLFFIFQAVILTSIFSGSSSISCHHWWIPFALSVLATALNVVSFCVVSFCTNVGYYLECVEKLDRNLEDRQLMRVHMLTRDQLNLARPGMIASGPRHGMKLGNGSVSAMARSRPNPFRTWKRRGLAYSGVAVLLAFSGVMIYGCRVILCNQKDLKCARTC